MKTQVLQLTNLKCDISCTNNFNNNTVIAIGVGGDVVIEQSCRITDASCQMRAAFESNIQNLLQTKIDQGQDAPSGLEFKPLAQQYQGFDYKSMVSNEVSQIMNSSCAISATNNRNNNYFLFQGVGGSVILRQDSEITSASCNMEMIAKQAAFNQDNVDAKNSQKITSVFAYFFIAMIIMVLLIGIAIVAFVLTGGANKLIDTGGKLGEKAGDILKDNPQLLMAL